MLHYIIQTIAFQLFFLIVYDLFLKNETFFNWNRAYLLLTAILSFILPFIKIEGINEVVPQEFIFSLPEIVVGQLDNQKVNAIPLEAIVFEPETYLSWSALFYLGILFSALLLSYKIIKLVIVIRKNPKQKIGNLNIVNLINSNAAFSFFQYIFLGEKINPNERKTILIHEEVHVKQKHTLDLLFFEMLRIPFWFNPLLYMYQNRIASLHEFIADSKAVVNHDKSSYYQNLLAQVFEVKKVSFINSFYKQSLIKKRIIMLSKSKSKQVQLLKYTLLIPMIFSMLIYTSCSQDKQGKEDLSIDIQINKNESILIDKIGAVKEQIQIQGNTTPEEEKGLSILLNAISGKDLNPELVKELQEYLNVKQKSPLSEKISDVLNQVQVQGNISLEEEKALKMLLVLTTENGFNNPDLEEVIEYVDVTFGVIENVPEHPNCKNLNTNEEKKNCMAKNISLHVQEHFNSKVADQTGLIGMQRINVIFKINNEGYVEGVKARASNKVLEEEAIRVIKLLPQFKPGMHEGKAVNVPYSLPIVFKIEK